MWMYTYNGNYRHRREYSCLWNRPYIYIYICHTYSYIENWNCLRGPNKNRIKKGEKHFWSCWVDIRARRGLIHTISSVYVCACYYACVLYRTITITQYLYKCNIELSHIYIERTSYILVYIYILKKPICPVCRLYIIYTHILLCHHPSYVSFSRIYALLSHIYIYNICV